MKPSLWIAAAVLLAGAGCQTLIEESPTSPGLVGNPVAPAGVPVISLPSGAVVPIVARPVPSPVPTPTPAPPAPAPAPQDPPTGAAPFDRVRVGFFGFTCGKGSKQPLPRMNEGRLPLGCKGFITATPKYKDLTDVPARIHGPHITWELEYGDGVVEVLDPTFASDFNKDLYGRRNGAFSICATVRGVRGCLGANVN